ncbi:MAG: fluoride efflux transporter CrcB [Opitutaceae bacterium]|jgi:CrcB protein|nr:fluoride efflux transporter CrcB [Opitutaceae bacterium]
MMIYLCIGLGGALGSMARFALAGAVDRWTGAAFPWGTLLVNATGCFVIGFFVALTAPGGRWPVGAPGRQGFMAGVLGGFTTFSAFSLQTLELAQAGRWLSAGGYAGASLAVCLAAVWLGHAAAVAVNPAGGG